MKKLIPLLLLVVMCTAGCDLTGLTVTTTTESPVIKSFDADPPLLLLASLQHSHGRYLELLKSV
jgi:hypothetical protein